MKKRVFPKVLAATSLCVGAIAALPVLSTPSANASTTGTSLAKVDDGLVDVNVDLPYQDASGAGTGMVLGSGGEILTNNHVVRDATSIKVVDLANKKTYLATVVGYDVNADVAVIHLTGATRLRRTPLGNSSKIKIGTNVTALGNAGGSGGTPSSTAGKITALDQSITADDELGGSEQLTGLIETSAALQPGDSGGSLVSSGKVIGMDTAGSTSFSLSSSSSAGYAIPINEALRIARNIEAGRASSAIHVGPTAFLGIDVEQRSYLNGTTITSGLVVTDVIAGTPAQQAGLVPGDVVTSFNGTAISSSSTLANLLIASAPGTAVVLGLLNPSGMPTTATVMLASGPAQ